MLGIVVTTFFINGDLLMKMNVTLRSKKENTISEYKQEPGVFIRVGTCGLMKP